MRYVAIIGSKTRCRTDYYTVQSIVRSVFSHLNPENDWVITTDSISGPDMHAKLEAIDNNFNWTKVGTERESGHKGPSKIDLDSGEVMTKKFIKYSGISRIVKIADMCDIMVAIWDGKSKSTLEQINRMMYLGKPVWVIQANYTNKMVPVLVGKPEFGQLVL